MQKHILDDRIKGSDTLLQQVVIPKESNDIVVSAELKKQSPLISEHTVAFDAVYKTNTQFLRSRLNANITITNKQLNKSAISCPNLLLNGFSFSNPDALPLAIAMFSQVYTEIEEYADGLTKNLHKFGREHEKTVSLLSNNPVEKNWFFLPYSLVRTLLNFDSLTPEYEPTKFERAVSDIRIFNFPMFYNRNVKKQGEQLELITSLVGKTIAAEVAVENLMAFENVFYWLDSSSREEYLCFTISPEFRNLLLLIVEYANQSNERFAKILPYSKIDWQYLHYLPHRNNIRQMYLFIKSNMVNFSKIKYMPQSFEYSTDELKKLMNIPQTSHYYNNDSHFVRDKIRNVITELMEERGFEYDIVIDARNIKTPGGKKEKRLKFTVTLNRSFDSGMRTALNFIRSLGLTGFNNDALILSCLRYCSAEILNREIKSSYEKFMGLLKVQSKKGKEEYTDFSSDSQICRFISSELTKLWQGLASKTFIKNPHSKTSREISSVVEPSKENNLKIVSSNSALALQKKGRGRPKKNVETSKLDGVKLSADEKKIYDEYEQEINLKRAEEAEKAKLAQIELENVDSPVSVDDSESANQQSMIDEHLNHNIGLDNIPPTNFNGGPLLPDENIWEGYNDIDVPNNFVDQGIEIGTFSITTENLKSFLIPINGKTDHYEFVDDYIENVANPNNSEAQQIFYTVFSLSNILNMCEQGNQELKNRSLVHIDLYKEKLNIVLQTLNVCFGTSVQRNDLTSYQSFALEIAVDHFSMNTIAIANGERIFTQKFFVQLADKVKNEKKLSPLKALFLCGQCVAYPFS